jgi:hypothetical protein
MNKAFTNPLFWTFYYQLEFDESQEVDVAGQMRDLSEEFPVRSEIIDGESRQHGLTVAEFALPCGSDLALLVEYQPDCFGSAITLYIQSRASGAKQQMGYWDTVRWHPYCLHPAEFDALLSHWADADPAWPDPRIALLLLAPFVGLSEETARRALAERVDAAFHDLCPGSDMPDLALHVPENYRWTDDASLGWLFSGEYPCYSMRNRAHMAGAEEFPFIAFGQLMQGIARPG